VRRLTKFCEAARVHGFAQEGGSYGDLTYSHVREGGLRDPPTLPLRPWPMRLLKFSEFRPLPHSCDAALLSPQPKDLELFGPNEENWT
jgi:hypothetical protein